MVMNVQSNGGVYSTEYGDDYESGVIEEAKEFLRFCSDNDSNNRVEALDDLKFAGGDQWPWTRADVALAPAPPTHI